MVIVQRQITCFLEILLTEDTTLLRHFYFYLPLSFRNSLLALHPNLKTWQLPTAPAPPARGLEWEQLVRSWRKHWETFPEGERYFGLENFDNTCYCNSVLQVFLIWAFSDDYSSLSSGIALHFYLNWI